MRRVRILITAAVGDLDGVGQRVIAMDNLEVLKKCTNMLLLLSRGTLRCAVQVHQQVGW